MTDDRRRFQKLKRFSKLEMDPPSTGEKRPVSRARNPGTSLDSVGPRTTSNTASSDVSSVSKDPSSRVSTSDSAVAREPPNNLPANNLPGRFLSTWNQVPTYRPFTEPDPVEVPVAGLGRVYDSELDDIRPALPSVSADTAWEKHRKSFIAGLEDFFRTGGPMPVHPENLIRDAQHSLLQWSKYVGTLDAPAETAKRRLGMCMEALERWAFFYPEYRSSFVTLWNQGKPATGSAEITASYFGEGRVRGKYRLERDALSIQGHRGPAPTVGETSHDQILDPGEASRRVMSLRPILAEKFEGHYESTPAERAAIRGTVLAAIWTSRATSDPQMRNAIAEQLRLLRTLCDEEAKNLAKRKRWRLLMFLSPVVLGLATLATHLSVLAITGSSRSAQHASEALLGAAVVLFFAAIFTRKKFERAIASARLAQSISVELLAFADGSQPLTPASRPDD